MLSDASRVLQIAAIAAIDQEPHRRDELHWNFECTSDEESGRLFDSPTIRDIKERLDAKSKSYHAVG